MFLFSSKCLIGYIFKSDWSSQFFSILRKTVYLDSCCNCYQNDRGGVIMLSIGQFRAYCYKRGDFREDFWKERGTNYHSRTRKTRKTLYILSTQTSIEPVNIGLSYSFCGKHWTKRMPHKMIGDLYNLFLRSKVFHCSCFFMLFMFLLIFFKMLDPKWKLNELNLRLGHSHNT